jgi:hypothetical protein
MPFFELKGIGFDCGLDKEQCVAYPNRCMECLQAKLNEFNFETKKIEYEEIDTPGRRLEHNIELIWKKFLDVLNIRRILIMEKSSGLTMLDYPIMDTDVDPSLLSGFIHANVAFSESDQVTAKDEYWEESKSWTFNEFQYRHFNLLMRTGNQIRVCLILNKAASKQLKDTTNKFQFQFETFHSTLIDDFREKGVINGENNPAIEFIVKSFEIHLVLPLVISHTIPPTVNLTEIQTTILNIARDMLGVKKYFFVYNLLENIKKSLKFKSNYILYEIYKLLEEKIFIPTSLEEIQHNIQQFEEEKSRRVADTESISEIITHDSELEQVEVNARNMSSDDAKRLIANYRKNAAKAEKNLIYPEALKEYEKALVVAKVHGLHKEILKLTKIRGETERKNKKIELEYAINASEAAEKKNQTLEAIRMTQKAIDIIENHLYSNGNVLKAKKLRVKLEKLRTQL